VDPQIAPRRTAFASAWVAVGQLRFDSALAIGSIRYVED
jgi:hypothetical protein